MMIFSLVAMIGSDKCCITSACLQWLCHSGERIVARGSLVFLILAGSYICCGYSLEVPQRGTSYEYPQHTFSYRNKKNIGTFQMKKVPYLELC